MQLCLYYCLIHSLFDVHLYTLFEADNLGFQKMPSNLLEIFCT